MVTNYNETAESYNGESIDIKRYIGVGTIKVLEVNPLNTTLRQYGWNIPEGAEEQNYVTVKDGKKSARVRFLVQIQELDEQPVVPIDFWISPEYRVSNNGGEAKVQVIDSFGRTAFLTRSEYEKHEVPHFESGEAKISNKYKMAYSGEAELVQFIRTFLNVNPFQVYDSNAQKWVPTKDPGEFTFDNWSKLCTGNAEEIRGYINLKPRNQMKVCFGIRTTQENKSYQTFLNTAFFLNNIRLDLATNKYLKVQKEIDRYMSYRGNNPNVSFQFEATPVHEWKLQATDVEDNSNGDMPMFPDTASDNGPMFPDSLDA